MGLTEYYVNVISPDNSVQMPLFTTVAKSLGLAFPLIQSGTSGHMQSPQHKPAVEKL